MYEKTGDGSEKKLMQHLSVDATLGPYFFKQWNSYTNQNYF